MSYAAVRHYRDADASVLAGEDSAHRQIGMLFESALARVAAARGAVTRGDMAGKLAAVSGTLAIIEHLRLVLDKNAGGALAQRLDALYDYMLRRLVSANLGNDAAGFDEVAGLLRPLRDSWAAIAPQNG